ncbi:hypothetical protein T11_16196 [Trichinella zimbabwensis]|uniref:Uncharacterized protein n=1 Tax=Trichinella zimbabwensis TaxID=268475 RepID=A0A0V1HQV3_9BILA|nr:hypothetical protein T11_16196 [Trichinella zimbabwensis]
MFTWDRKKRKLVEEKKLLLKNVSRDEKKEPFLLQTLNFFFRSLSRTCARSFPKLKLDRGGKINFSRFISPNPSAFVCFRGNRLAAHTLAVIERCQCACGSAANATTLAKLSLYHWLYTTKLRIKVYLAL